KHGRRGALLRERRLRAGPAVGHRGRRAGIGLRDIACAWAVHAPCRRPDPGFPDRGDRHLSLGLRLQLGKPRHRISVVLGARGFPFSGARRSSVVGGRADRPGDLSHLPTFGRLRIVAVPPDLMADFTSAGEGPMATIEKKLSAFNDVALLLSRILIALL